MDPRRRRRSRVPQHFGVRTRTHKLMYFPGDDEWNLFDLVRDPGEMVSLYGRPEVAAVQEELTREYARLRAVYEAPGYAEYAPRPKKKK